MLKFQRILVNSSIRHEVLVKELKVKGLLSFFQKLGSLLHAWQQLAM